MAADRSRRGTVRVRTTAAAVAVVAVVLVVASVAMVVLLRRSLTGDVRLAAQQRAAAIADLVSASASLRVDRVGDDEFIQIVDGEGRVVVASDNVANEPSFAGHTGESLEVPFDDDPFLVATAEAGERTVVVGRTLDTVVESSAAVVGLLAIGVPLLLAVVAAITWRVVGAALAPVESIRSEVLTISTERLDRRVPVPATSDEIARLATTMNEMLERLQAGTERQRRFVSDASHELRSPVATIRQHAEVALSHPEGTSIDYLAGVVLAEDLRLQRLVEDLLLLTRMDENATHPRAQIDLDDVVFEDVARRDGRSHIDVRGVSSGRIAGDRNAIGRLVANLLDNGCRHSRDGVTVALFEHGDDVVLQVDDDGPGIPPEERSRVFERFVRLEEARDRDSGGAGLGLAIVAEVAARHGGTAEVSESPRGGARIEVRFPRAQ
ncbi:MAG: sensor histidine kinase [Actinomycetota bacterium]